MELVNTELLEPLGLYELDPMTTSIEILYILSLKAHPAFVSPMGPSNSVPGCFLRLKNS